MSEILFEEHGGGVGVITFNRPDKRNAFNTHMRRGLYDLLRDNRLQSLTAVVLKANGPSFCAGADLKEGLSATDKQQTSAGSDLMLQFRRTRPIVIGAVGSYLFFGQFGLTNTRTGLVLAHTALATPFVVITVTATLSTYDNNLTRAALSLGAPPTSAFFRITLPNIMPGVVSGAIFAFATSFDEVVVALFMTAAEQRTLPVQMFSGIRDQINPTIMAAATLLLALSVVLFCALAFLTRRRAG